MRALARRGKERSRTRNSHKATMIAEDPDDLVDILPQPYRMLDKVVAQIVEGAIDECLEREKADKVYELRGREPTKTYDFGEDCTCFATTSDSKQIVAGYGSGKLSVLSAEDESVVVSQDLEQGNIQAVVCYKSKNGEELFCVYAYGSLALYKIIQVEKEVEVEVAQEAEDEAAASEDGPPAETTVTKLFPALEKAHQVHIREPKSEHSNFELVASLNKRYIGLFILDAEPEAKFFEVRKEEKVEEEVESEEGGEAKDKDAEDGDDGADAVESEPRLPTFTHELIDLGTVDKDSSQSFFEQTLREICYFWVVDAKGEDAGILVWDKGGSTLVFKQLCPTFVGSISTVEGKNSTWRLSFPISCVTYDSASEVLAIGSRKGFVSLWNMFYRDHLSFLKEGCYPTAIKVLGEGGATKIACTSSDASMCVYDMGANRVTKRVILPFVASSLDLGSRSGSRWLLHGKPEGQEEGAQVASVVDLGELKPQGTDILISTAGESSGRTTVVFTVSGDRCSVMTTLRSAVPEGEKAQESNESKKSSPSGKKKESPKKDAGEAEPPVTTTSTLDVYAFPSDEAAPGDPKEGAKGAEEGGLGMDSAYLQEKSVVFKCLFDHIKKSHASFASLDDDFEREKVEIRRHLVNLDIQAGASGLV